ncbi:MAG TPA: hypothetical protein VG839_07435 [Asticcacaulis sp.]|nr:hypothetical protein [Asticcacaulis sp.]
MPTVSIPSDFTDAEPAAILDGGMMLWAGLSFGAASLAQYLTLAGFVHLPNPAMTGLIWMAAMAVFVLGGIVLKVGSRRSHLNHPAVKRFRAIWLSLILGAFVVTAALIVVLVKAHLGPTAAFISAPIMTAVYGIGWRIAGVMSGNNIFAFLSLGSFAAAIGLAALAGMPEQSLAYAITLVCFAALPGAVLMSRQA